MGYCSWYSLSSPPPLTRCSLFGSALWRWGSAFSIAKSKRIACIWRSPVWLLGPPFQREPQQETTAECAGKVKISVLLSQCFVTSWPPLLQQGETAFGHLSLWEKQSSWVEQFHRWPRTLEERWIGKMGQCVWVCVYVCNHVWWDTPGRNNLSYLSTLFVCMSFSLSVSFILFSFPSYCSPPHHYQHLSQQEKPHRRLSAHNLYTHTHMHRHMHTHTCISVDYCNSFLLRMHSINSSKTFRGYASTTALHFFQFSQTFL